MADDFQDTNIVNTSENKAREFENLDLIPISKLALRIQLAATGIASSFILLFVPNVETISFLTFFAGFMFPLSFAIGVTLTMVIGWELLISMILSFSGITFFFKLFAWLLITMLGTLARKLQFNQPIQFGVLGALSALIFDLLTTISIPLLFIDDNSAFIPLLITYLIFGLPFTIMHTIANFLLFYYFPKIITTLIPVFEHRYRFLITINEQYFNQKTKYFRTLLLISIIIFSGLSAGYYITQVSNDPIEEINILITIDYADVLPIEVFNETVITSMTLLEITELVANVTTKYNRKYVAGINGVIEDEDISGYYWIIYINDMPSPIGVFGKLSTLDVTNSDLISWIYELGI